MAAVQKLPKTVLFLLLFLLFIGLGFYLYRPALKGPLLSDDVSLVLGGMYAKRVSLDSLAAIFNPLGSESARTANYAPLHLLGHLLEFQFFGADLRGYHAVNIVLHALNAVLLSAFLRAGALPMAAAVAGGFLFWLHPANAEAVAWISQLKTLLAFAFAVGALLLLKHRPFLATLCFALGLLCKASAAFALPVAAVWLWCFSTEAAERRRSTRWLALWALLFAAYAVPESQAFRHTGEFSAAAHLNSVERLAFSLAVIGRYCLLVLTGTGTSVFHQPPAPRSFSDLWLLFGLLVFSLAALCAIRALRARNMEAVYWTWAAVSFVPVSQFFPFKFPMADRYLYFILPGLLGAALTALTPVLIKMVARYRSLPPHAANGWKSSAAAVGAAIAIALAWQTHTRAAVFRSSKALLEDAARHYPQGTQAFLYRGYQHALAGEIEAAVAALERAHAGGYRNVHLLNSSPDFESLRDHPRFQKLTLDMATWHKQRLQRLPHKTQWDLRVLGDVHMLLGEHAEAMRAFSEAISLGGTAYAKSFLLRRLLEARSALQRARESTGSAIAPAGAAPLAAPDKGRDLILISVDTLRADFLGAYGAALGASPQLDAFAAESVVFEYAYAPAPFTLPSVSALLTGFHPDEIGMHANQAVLPDDVPTLATQLRAQGWRTGAVVSNFVLHAAAGLQRGFELYNDEIPQTELNRKLPERIASATTDAALATLSRLRSSSNAPLFLWVHYQDPHGPYTPPAADREFFLPWAQRSKDADWRIPTSEKNHGLGKIPYYQALGTDHNVAFYRAGYAGEIRYLDREIGRLLQALSEQATTKETVLLFTADHGESLGEAEQWFSHGEYLTDPSVRIPLWLRASGLTPGRRRDVATLLDVAPTLYAAVGAQPPAQLTGRSLLAPGAEKAPSTLYLSTFRHSTLPRSGLIANGFKYLISIHREQIEEQLFRLGEETTDLREAEPEQLERLREQWQTLTFAPDAQLTGKP